MRAPALQRLPSLSSYASLPINKRRKGGRRGRAVRGSWVLAIFIIGILAAARSGRADEFRAGSFTKSTGGAPASQSVAHGLGATPKALILWTVGKTGSSFATHHHFSIGFSDGTTSKSVTASSQGSVSTSNSSRRMANKALTIVEYGETLLAEADLSSWDATSFTLNWTTNNSTAYVIHFIAFYAPSISAKVLEWTMGTSTGNRAVTGVGFRPAFVLHAYAGDGFTSSLPATAADCAIGLGVMDASGNQWANMILGLDNVSNSDAQRGQQTDACLYSFDNSLAVTKEASWTSMDSDGFTVNFSTANSNAGQVISLALTGLNVKVGSFAKAS